MTATLDLLDLETKVKAMYRQVAQEPHGTFHFELGEKVAMRVGYDVDRLAAVPTGAKESFAGVGYFFDLADLSEGESVVDLGSGSGMDVFFAADRVGQSGSVVGIDFTVQQLEKARRIAEESGFAQVELREGRIEKLPVEGATCDCVISNGVINLAPEKEPVFAEAARVLKPGGRLAIADIVSEHQMKESIVCDADLWASCIGGAAQQDAYREAIEAAGLRIEEIRDNPYEFISDRARDASAKYGVKSVSLLAIKS